jgi:hypothetical protein
LSSILANTGSIPDVDVKWDFQSAGEDQYGNPSTIISLDVNGKKYEIAKELGNYNEITSDNFKDYKIPENALAACGGWWAGAGVDYWVIKKGNNLNVFMREISEGDPNHPGDYVTKPKNVKTISLE